MQTLIHIVIVLLIAVSAMWVAGIAITLMYAKNHGAVIHDGKFGFIISLFLCVFVWPYILVHLIDGVFQYRLGAFNRDKKNN